MSKSTFATVDARVAWKARAVEAVVGDNVVGSTAVVVDGSVAVDVIYRCALATAITRIVATPIHYYWNTCLCSCWSRSW
jgi:hypothetical protein